MDKGMEELVENRLDDIGLSGWAQPHGTQTIALPEVICTQENQSGFAARFADTVAMMQIMTNTTIAPA